MGYINVGRMMQKPAKRDAWKPGEPLTDEDRELLRPVIEVAERLGFSPRIADVPNARLIKRRFRTWKNVLLAAGLPSYSAPEQGDLRQAANMQHR